MRPKKRHVAALIVALLVIGAGCVGGGGGSADGDDGDETTAAATTDGGTTGGVATTGPGGGGGGELNFDDYRSRVRQQGSYAVDWQFQVRDPDGRSLNQSGTTMVDFESGERYQVWTIEGQGTSINYEIYRPPGSEKNYVCIKRNDECLRQMTTTGDGDQFVFRNFTTPFAQLGVAQREGFEDRGIVSTDQGQRRKYVATEETMDVPTSQYEDLRIELYVDPSNGLVTRVVYVVTGAGENAPTTRWSYSYEFGVDVSPPDWYEG